MPADRTSPLTITANVIEDACVLTVDGVLDSRTYLSLRDSIIKAALDEPRAVVVDVTALDVPAESALAVFTSARWLVGRWPEVPIMLVCEHSVGRKALVRNGITRYVPLYATTESAIMALSESGGPRYRRRARAYLPATPASVARSRQLVAEWLAAWSQTDLIPIAKLIVSVFVENVLAHTESAPGVRLESDGSAVTVAVEDESTAPAGRREGFGSGAVAASGLAVVAALCRTWGYAPTPSGKTVWAVIGPENRL